jgi:hypothetical protein
MLTMQQLTTQLSYDPISGDIRWKIDKYRDGPYGSLRLRGKAGDLVTVGRHGGYLQIKIETTYYRAHQVAWYLHYGAWPAQTLDHKNGNRRDNSIANLRLATNSENGQNQKRSARNKSGYKGVTMHKASGLWRACIVVDGKQRSLGYFKDPAEGHRAYCEAAVKHFGEFARAA